MNYKIPFLVVLTTISNYAFSDIETPQNNDAEIAQPGSCCLLFTGKEKEITTYESGKTNLGTFDKDGRFIYPKTNKPYTGNLDVINNDWGSDVVEFNKNYVDGILHGHEKVFYKSGKLKSIGNFNQGKVDGNVKLYYEDGSIQGNVYFNHGIREGRAVSYYPNGNKQLEQFFRNDILNGLRRTWYENGNMMESIPYSKGLVHGVVETYYENGSIFERVKYDYGTPKFMRVYSEDGTLSEEKGFFDRKVIEQIIG